MIKWIIKTILSPKWVAFQYPDSPEDGEYELGISVFGVVIGLYKADTIYPDKPTNIRRPGEREFGESIFPVSR